MFCSQNLRGVLDVSLSLREGTCPFKNFGSKFEGPPLGVFDTLNFHLSKALLQSSRHAVTAEPLLL